MSWHESDEGTDLLRRLRESDDTLTTFRLDNNNCIADDGAKALADALKSNTTLTSLYLDRQSIQDDGAKALADALKSNTALRTLRLDTNSIQNEGVTALAHALKENTALRTLHLDNNSIEDAGAKALAEALKNNTNLTTLHLHKNSIEDVGAKALAEAFKNNTTLRTLRLDNNCIGDNGAKALAEALKNNSTLTSLNLDNNSIQNDGTKALAEALKNRTLTKPPNIIGDDDNGIDQLGVRHQADALANMIAFKDLQPPFVVGILGGWGSGKSYFFNLMKRRLIEIQKYKSEAPGVDYVGHIYLVKFDAWTFAKGSLWSSLMYQILVELNDQLDLEETLLKMDYNLTEKGISLIEIMDTLSHGDRNYLNQVVPGKTMGDDLEKWSKNIGVTAALAKAIYVQYDKDVKKLNELKMNYKFSEKLPFLSWTWLWRMKKSLLKNGVAKSLEDAINDLDWGSRFLFRLLHGTHSISDSIPSIIVSVLVLVVIAIPWMVNKVPDTIKTWWTAAGSTIALLFKYLSDIRQVVNISNEIIKESDKVNADGKPDPKQGASKSGNKEEKDVESQSGNDAEKVESKSKNKKTMKEMEECIKALESELWIREGDSIGKVVKDRISDADYAKELGLVHRAHQDLTQLSDAFLSPKRDSLFPRGNPRIVLFVDDLDRCPPRKVVEMLEALQLLVKTKLFVVVVTLDTRFVSLSLESEYKDILHPECSPSGLDYLEKIIQLPYWLPPMEKQDDIENFITAQTDSKGNSKGNDGGQGLASDDSAVDQANIEATQNSASNKPTPGCWLKLKGKCKTLWPCVSLHEKQDLSQVPANTHNSSQVGPATEDSSQVPQNDAQSVQYKMTNIEFSPEEKVIILEACMLANVTTPRTVKQLINVVKVLKIIWHGQQERLSVPTENFFVREKFFVLVLSLCASKVKGVRYAISKFFQSMEILLEMPEGFNLKDFMSNVTEKMSNKQGINNLLEGVTCSTNDEWKVIKEQLQQIRSFSFLGYADFQGT
jgi:hypothetical protein